MKAIKIGNRFGHPSSPLAERQEGHAGMPGLPTKAAHHCEAFPDRLVAKIGTTKELSR